MVVQNCKWCFFKYEFYAVGVFFFFKKENFVKKYFKMSMNEH